MITSTGLSATEFDMIDMTTGEVYYSIYRLDDEGRLYLGQPDNAYDDGSTVEKRNTALLDFFYRKI